VVHKIWEKNKFGETRKGRNRSRMKLQGGIRKIYKDNCSGTNIQLKKSEPKKKITGETQVDYFTQKEEKGRA